MVKLYWEFNSIEYHLFDGPYQVATVWPDGRWQTWHRYGKGGDGGRERDVDEAKLRCLGLVIEQGFVPGISYRLLPKRVPAPRPIEPFTLYATSDAD